MKKMALKKEYLILIALSLLIVFLITVIIQKNREIEASQQRIDELASSCIENAGKYFSRCLENPLPEDIYSSEEYYAMGLSAFYAFYSLYPETSHYDVYNGILLNDTYDRLLRNDRVTAADMQCLVEALEFLADNYSNYNGYMALEKFKQNILTRYMDELGDQSDRG